MNYEKFNLFMEEVIKEDSNLIGLSLVGSATYDEKPHDLDYLLLVEDREEALKSLYRYFDKFHLSIMDDAIKINGFLNTEISVAIYTVDSVRNISNSFVEGRDVIGEHKTWATGYKLVEGFIKELAAMRIIVDPSNVLVKIKSDNQKYSEKSRAAILQLCGEEILFKSSLLEFIEGTLEYDLVVHDIILAVIRYAYAANEIFLSSFKRIDAKINALQEHDSRLLREIIKSKQEPLKFKSNLYKLLIRYTPSQLWKERFYFGTWQFGGDFKPLTDDNVIELMKLAKRRGVFKWDTALVYGDGNVERLLSRFLGPQDVVLTKIPAKKIPTVEDADSNVSNYYDEQYIAHCVDKSRENLNREKLDIVLLHNWMPSWESPMPLKALKNLKDRGIVRKVGISFPNQFNIKIPDFIFDYVDVIEAPLNEKYHWIEDQIEHIKDKNVEVILRSMFLQGTLIRHPDDVQRIFSIIKNYNTSIVVGMTTKEQIDSNLKIMQEN